MVMQVSCCRLNCLMHTNTTIYGRLTKASAASIIVFSELSQTNSTAHQFRDQFPPKNHPRLVHFRIPHNNGKVSLHASYTTLRMMLLARVRNGLLLNIDMIVGPRIDNLFLQTERHTGAAYPYPIFSKFNLAHEFPSYNYHALKYFSMVYHMGIQQQIPMHKDWASIYSVTKKLTK